MNPAPKPAFRTELPSPIALRNIVDKLLQEWWKTANKMDNENLPLETGIELAIRMQKLDQSISCYKNLIAAGVQSEQDKKVAEQKIIRLPGTELPN